LSPDTGNIDGPVGRIGSTGTPHDDLDTLEAGINATPP